MAEIINKLDDLEAIKTHDASGQLLASIQTQSDQYRQTWDEIQQLQFTPISPIHNIVVAGLGGSAFGADLARTLFKSELDLPIDISRDYTLPNYINPHTLVILASYSGTTEESINCLRDIEEKQPQVMAIATGGDIIDYAKRHHHPFFQINPLHNPANQARTALGYSLLGTLGLLRLAGALPSFNSEQVEEIILTLLSLDKAFAPEVPTAENPAKLLALQLIDRRPTLVAADFLEGAVHIASNNFNEDSKTLFDYKIVPEMNHHYLEGLSYPTTLQHDAIFVFVRSEFNHPRNQQRLELNQELLDRLDIPNFELPLTTESRLTQAFELITLCFYASYYLAFLLGLDPTPTPHVHWLKEKLGKMST